MTNIACNIVFLKKRENKHKICYKSNGKMEMKKKKKFTHPTTVAFIRAVLSAVYINVLAKVVVTHLLDIQKI